MTKETGDLLPEVLLALTGIIRGKSGHPKTSDLKLGLALPVVEGVDVLAVARQHGVGNVGVATNLLVYAQNHATHLR
jgi:hypothetical protein